MMHTPDKFKRKPNIFTYLHQLGIAGKYNYDLREGSGRLFVSTDLLTQHPSTLLVFICTTRILKRHLFVLVTLLGILSN